MKSIVTESSNVINFLGVDYKFNKTKIALLNEINECFEKIPIPNKLNDWTVEFKLLYNNVKNLGIARKTKSIQSQKVKEIVIHVPIPKKVVIDWGVQENQLIREIQFDKRYIDEIEIEIKNYKNRSEYIIEIGKIAIQFIFKSGFTISGERIIIKK
jgi:hypothetical protein